MSEAVRGGKPRNPLGYERIPKLLVRFAVPSIISMLVSALYNIVDQFFIGQGVGMLGNAATNVAFPLVTFCTATALLLGLGGSSAFNLAQGEGKPEVATRIAATAATLMVIFGVGFAVVVLVFLRPLMLLFGATDAVMPFALDYTGITAFGIPFLIFSTGYSSLIRSDGSPTYAMACVLVGAAINTILDPLFIFGLNWGIAGAAWATVIGQVVSGLLCFRYIFRFKTVKLKKKYFYPTVKNTRRVLSLGLAGFFNQVSMAVVQIVLNNVLTTYGAESPYGTDIPLAVAGIISKCTMLFMAVIVGTGQGNQPIVGFNYGARQYSRVRKAWLLAAGFGTVVSVIGFLCFQFFPIQIIRLFGEGSPEYYEFAIRYFRTFLLMFFLIGVHPVTANFFTSIGKPIKGIFIALTRQVIFFIPLLLLLPNFFGIDGVMYAAPISDTVSTLLALTLVFLEFRIMKRQKADITETDMPSEQPVSTL